jgi:hypothetical protein
VRGTAERGISTAEIKLLRLRSETTSGQLNVAHPPLGDKHKIFLSPLHIELSLKKYP